MKWLTVLCCLLLVVLGGSGWILLGNAGAGGIDAPALDDAARPPTAPDARRQALHLARCQCRPEALDHFVAEQRQLVAQAPDDAARHELLAEALLERILLRNLRRGMSVGAPLYGELPLPIAEDIRDGLAMVARARALGARTAELLRIEASLLSQRITGLATALQLNARIQEKLTEAHRLDEHNPALHVALGMRKLLAPRLLGHDPSGALQHFEFAAGAMPADERPRVFAGMATYLLQKRERAIDWLRQAVQVNPRNAFASAVLARLEKGEPDPFGRDVDQDR